MTLTQMATEIAAPTIVYLLGFVFTACRVASYFYWKKMNQYSVVTWGDPIFCGLCNAAAWPVSLPIWLLFWKAEQSTRSYHQMSTVGRWILKPPAALQYVADRQQQKELGR